MRRNAGSIPATSTRKPSVLTINEIDEALAHLAAVPEPERGPAWHAYLDTLLDAKNQTKDTA